MIGLAIVTGFVAVAIPADGHAKLILWTMTALLVLSSFAVAAP